MISGITVRPMDVQDLEKVLALYQQPEVDNGESLDLKAAEEILETTASYPFYRFFVAQTDANIVVGVFGLLIMENLGHMGARSGLVEGVCVDPSLHGQGIGKIMMQRAAEICRENKCYKLSLSSNLKREKAHAFYVSLGFREHGKSFYIELDA